MDLSKLIHVFLSLVMLYRMLLEVGIKYKESFPPLLIVLFLHVKGAIGGPKILLYENLANNASKLSSYGLNRCRNRSIMMHGGKYDSK